MDAVVKNIRSALISTKGKCDLRTLQRDYQMLMGQNIPYQDFGYKRLEEFLKNCPTLSISKGPGGEILVDAVPTDKSAHISSLVDRQKTKTKEPKIPVRRGPPRSPRRIKQTNWVPASSGKKWQPSYQASSRPAAVSHNQIVDWDNKRMPPRLQRKGSNRNNKHSQNQNHAPHMTDPHTRARLNTRSKREDHENENIKPPTPPIMEREKEREQGKEKIEVEKSITSRLRLRRAISQPQPVNGNDAPVNTINDIEFEQKLQVVNLSISGTTRPRMRTHHGQPTTPTFSNPTISSPILFTTPQLPQNQIDELRRNALAAVNLESSIWNWSSSDESTSRLSGRNSIETMSDKSDISCRSSILLELKNFVAKNNLGETNIIVKERGKGFKKNGGKILYDCVIKISNHTYSSYPNDYFTKETAQTAAASEALKDLQEKYGKKENLLIATENDILERIPPILIKHPGIVWASQIKQDYEQDFNEQLPSNWLKVLDSLPTIIVESIEKKYVLQYCKSGKKSKGQINAPSSDVSVPSNTVRVTEEGTVVQITCALSTIEVWCREVYTPEAEAYNTMNDEMQIFYNIPENISQSARINTGGFYVAYIDEMYCRVRVLEVLDHEVMCFFIDFGDEYLIPKSQIFVLYRQFARQQAQAFVCRLGGLEELVNICSPTQLEQITGKTLHATAIPTSVSENEEDADSVLTIILYDVMDDTDININQELIKVITINSTVVSLDQDIINKVYVSHAEQNGYVHVQPCCDGYDRFMDLMADLDGIAFETEVQNMIQNPDNLIVKDQLYLTKWSEDDRYYRCIILDISPNKKYAQIFFVDYGNTDVVTLENSYLFPLDLISDVLFWFPYQAVRVKINIDPQTLPDNFPEKIQEILPNDQVTLLKILRTDEKGEHYCDFFKRSAEELLFSVNSALLLENEIAETNLEDGNNNDKLSNLQKKMKRLRIATIQEDMAKKPVPSTGLLKAPALPPVEGYFEVMIPFAVSPWNFFIQPYETARELRELMRDLQEKYKDVAYSPVQMDDIIPGKIYASKHDDGFWYRTSVIKVINSGSISVFYCDFGYYNNLKIYQLIPLEEKYMEFPFQACKAKLNGVKPKKNKWSMEDCKFFKQLVLKKTFPSTIKDIQNDELYKYDLVLSLELIDTSSADDIKIDELLIQKGIAIREE